MFGVGRDLCGSSSPTPLPKQSICLPLLPLKSLYISVSRSQGLWACERGGSWEQMAPQVWGEQRRTGPGVGVPTSPMPQWEKDDTKGCSGAGSKGDTGAQPDPTALVLVAVNVQLPGHTEHLRVLEAEMLSGAWTSWELRQIWSTQSTHSARSKVRLSLAV